MGEKLRGFDRFLVWNDPGSPAGAIAEQERELRQVLGVHILGRADLRASALGNRTSDGRIGLVVQHAASKAAHSAARCRHISSAPALWGRAMDADCTARNRIGKAIAQRPMQPSTQP
jgi:hypothetical protein